jgi:hypothetical protein
MAKKDSIPQKASTGHLHSPADAKRYNVPRSFGASPKANPFNKGSGVDLAQHVSRPNLKGGTISSRGGPEKAAQHGGTDLAKTFPISLKHVSRPRGRN